MQSRISWFLTISFLVLLSVFALANTTSVAVQMPFVFRAEIPLAMVLAVATLIGFMIGSLWTAWMLRRRHQAKAEQEQSPEAENSELSTDQSPPESAVEG